ncbi:GIY-YIG nuclease family protein [Gordonia sp. NB41Y]|uniref:GIY-YIG nuclease family protein n=1 Tax=Gordonia sp. NB41Y TaxID=875808 RepID=UPI0006B1FD8E|nr:GIY-YIG nuclease family protein [Gordonia sp. NB41Y]EMP14664.2 excinuclease ABC subunit C [Gordonia sp. NB41Y]WLP91874.1 GIY-YIG nuclease family protein [Gordonia sp. NB41Y]
MSAFMYILECADGSYYVGSTRNIERRLHEHNAGVGAAFTRRRRPVRVAYLAEFVDIGEAYKAEKQVQGWSRAKRKALVDGDFDALRWLARRPWERR